ncbi:MAG: leucine--tRNA ligase [Candidatus Liptonbacteria bacterium]|nr:leucine--tRNA ligase [Candidatus Liptonbacteria bacterium]
MKYDFKKIEKKWQERWLDEKVFRADDKSKKPKFYQLETFPYPSAEGLHVGHPKGYTAEDIHARFMRMRGYEVLYAMGWDAFGLPTENYAIKVGKNPKEVAKANIKNFKRQVQMFGFSYDWDREINTSDPEYYKWTQWLFIQLFKKGLAYRAKAKVNWCPKDMTVLANEQVVQQNGKNVCERCKSEVVQKEMEQWFLKITDYVERLIEDLGPGTATLDATASKKAKVEARGSLDWPEATIKRQKDWIGKSEGALLKFEVRTDRSDRTLQAKRSSKQSDRTTPTFIEVFTTRPDTLFGATYLVLSPEHKLIGNNELGIRNYEEIQRYIEKAKRKTGLERMTEAKDKTGVELEGVKAINPATKEEIPVWVADYVLGSYGTGAIMAVPAHDERDFDFATKHNLPIRMVVCPHYPAPTCPVLDEAYLGEGHMVDSGKFDGMESEKAKWEITKFVGGKRKVQYKIRDWSVSRQRYWGVPIPMIHCEKCGIVPVPERDLPVLLPDLEDYRPKGKPPLASSEKFIKTKCPKCGGEAEREPETLDTFVDSAWYYLRYTDPHNDKMPFDKLRASHWMPVDFYVIGAEHTVLHLLYSRFITKFLHDEGYLSSGGGSATGGKFQEPFLKLRHVGLIIGADGQKMSKSRGNVVNPDELLEVVGADVVRVYEMFMGPFDQGQPWDTQGVLGAERFLQRVWKLYSDANIRMHANDTNNANFGRLLHKTIKKVTEDIETLNFNTAISAMMILLNEMEKQDKLPVKSYELFVKLLAPFAPHMAEEIWHEILDHKTYLHEEKWPEYDPKLIKEEKFTLVIQINGRVRDSVEVEAGISQAEAEKLVLAREKVRAYLKGAKPKKVIYVPGRLISIIF